MNHAKQGSMLMTAIVAIAASLWGSTAHAAFTYTFCPTVWTTFDDTANISDDEWKTDDFQAFESGHMVVTPCGSNTAVFNADTSSSGCGTFTRSTSLSCVNVAITSFGHPNGNTVYGYDSAGSLATSTVSLTAQSGATQTITYPANDALRMYMTVAHIMNWRFLGHVSSKTIQVYATDAQATCGCAPGPGTRSCCAQTDTAGKCVLTNMCMNASDKKKKYAIGHEYGHCNLYLTDAMPENVDCDFGGPGHNWGTQEYSTCAFSEGWANFVAVDAWNDHDTNADGYDSNVCLSPAFVVPPPADTHDDCPGADLYTIIDIEGQGCHDECKVKYMESYFPSSSWSGLGTELDWARTLWDYHTNSGGSNPGTAPGHVTMQDEIRAMPTVLVETALYDFYRMGIANNSGCTQLARMDYMTAANGADHCQGVCRKSKCD